MSRRIDRDDRQIEPELGQCGDARHCDVAVELDDGLDLRVAEPVDRVAELALADLRLEKGLGRRKVFDATIA
jgi:hypothetical protein